MLMHPDLSLAVAKTRSLDLIREARPRAEARHAARPNPGDSLKSPGGAGLAHWFGHAMRRVSRGGAAEPAS